MNEIGGHVGLQNELHIQTTQSLPNHSSHEIKTMSSLKPWFFLVTSEAGLRPVVRFLMDLQSFFGTTNFYNLTLSRMRTPLLHFPEE